MNFINRLIESFTKKWLGWTIIAFLAVTLIAHLHTVHLKDRIDQLTQERDECQQLTGVYNYTIIRKPASHDSFFLVDSTLKQEAE